ncbi:MAG TPA: HNH endonuclease signature motif containing protein [Bacteroidota bacterium]|nr:HNH endonuclease signature motif containing protein [Bacteroidota bacterium]
MGPHARPAPAVDRRRNKGVRIGSSRRRDLLRIPCYFCGEKATTIDHLLARSKGGTNGFDNLVSACALCNTMKSDKSYDELIAFCTALETATTQKRGLKALERFRLFKEQARKILEWHAKRLAARPPRECHPA